MPTYVYESIPQDGGTPQRFEVVQSMSDAPLTTHPTTGEPVRRIVTGGMGVMGKPIRRSTTIDKSLAAATPCGCAKGTLAAMSAAKQPRQPRVACTHRHGHGHRH